MGARSGLDGSSGLDWPDWIIRRNAARESSESVGRDPSRCGPGGSERPICDVQLIEMYILLIPVACGHAIVQR